VYLLMCLTADIYTSRHVDCEEAQPFILHGQERECKGKVRVLNQLSTTALRRMGSGGIAPPFSTSELDEG
jgi:hypothetical protein